MLDNVRPPRHMLVRGALRAICSTVAIVTVYYLLPLDHSSVGVAVTMLVVGLTVFIALVVYEVRAIVASKYPGVRAIVALAVTIPLFLVLFAASYVILAANSSAQFGQALTRTDAMYFTVTVFATVGFGDITAKSEVARLIVTGQMVADLVVIGLGLRVIVGAVTRGQQRREADPDGGGPAGRAGPQS